MDTTILKVKDLTKKYDKNTVLSKINLSFKSGQFYALLGENGAGKSTLMRLLTQSESDYSGDISYLNLNLNHIDTTIKTDSVYLDESISLSINKSLNDWSQIFNKTYEVYDLATFKHLTEILNIDPTKVFFSLSRGQKAKALFALEAAKKPKVYFLDEITAVLDIGSRFALVNFLEKEIKDRNCTVIMSTNIATELPSSRSHIVFLKDASVIMDCHYNELSGLFKKFKTNNETEEKILLSYGACFIAQNSDESKSFVLPINKLNDSLKNIKEDNRQISISEIITFYTTANGL